MSLLTIRLGEPILPVGASINFEISANEMSDKALINRALDKLDHVIEHVKKKGVV